MQPINLLWSLVDLKGLALAMLRHLLHKDSQTTSGWSDSPVVVFSLLGLLVFIISIVSNPRLTVKHTRVKLVGYEEYYLPRHLFLSCRLILGNNLMGIEHNPIATRMFWNRSEPQQGRWDKDVESPFLPSFGRCCHNSDSLTIWGVFTFSCRVARLCMTLLDLARTIQAEPSSHFCRLHFHLLSAVHRYLYNTIRPSTDDQSVSSS